MLVDVWLSFTLQTQIPQCTAARGGGLAQSVSNPVFLQTSSLIWKYEYVAYVKKSNNWSSLTMLSLDAFANVGVSVKMKEIKNERNWVVSCLLCGVVQLGR